MSIHPPITDIEVIKLKLIRGFKIVIYNDGNRPLTIYTAIRQLPVNNIRDIWFTTLSRLMH